ncbi:MAG: nitroreductase/quinone reductase family protein [Caldilineaceae bacterium]
MKSETLTPTPATGFRFLNQVLNPFVRFMLHSPWHALMSGSLLLLTYQGRKSGQEHTLPVQYVQVGQTFYMVAGQAEQKRWWRNLVGGAPVRLWVRGQEYQATAQVFTGGQADADLVDGLLTYFTRFPAAAQERGVSRLPDGSFDRSTVQAAATQMTVIHAVIQGAG